MTERDRERVRFILADRTHLGQEPSHHESHLLLRRGPLPHDGKLHFRGRVLVDGGSALAGGQEDHPPDVPDLESGQGALPDERRLHGDLVGLELVEDPEESVVDGEETVGERKGGARGDHAGALVVDASPVEEEEPEAGDAAPGIDTENPDGPRGRRDTPDIRRRDTRGCRRRDARDFRRREAGDSLALPPVAIRASRGGPR